MKKRILFVSQLLGLAVLSSSASAYQEAGRVISATPIMQQVAVPQQVCNVQQVAVQQPKSGAGALLGAIVGGVAGNSFGDGGGRAAATMAGVIGGAVLGDQAQAQPPLQVQNVQQCSTQTVYENRPAGYNVTYEYAGKTYTAQLPEDPGPYIKLLITPVSLAAPAAAPPLTAQPTVIESRQIVQPATVVYSNNYPVYPAYRVYAPPPVISVGFGYSRYSRGGRYWR